MRVRALVAAGLLAGSTLAVGLAPAASAVCAPETLVCVPGCLIPSVPPEPKELFYVCTA